MGQVAIPRESAASMMFCDIRPGIQLVCPWLLDEDEGHRCSQEGPGAVAAGGHPLDLVPVADDDHRPVLEVLGAARPPGRLEHRIEVFLV